MMKVLALAAAAALAAIASAEHTVWRPADWGGPFRKDLDIKQSTKVADSVFGHGIAQPHVLPCDLGDHCLDGAPHIRDLHGHQRQEALAGPRARGV